MDDLTRFRERLFAALRDGPPLTVAIAADTAVRIFGPEVRRLRRELGRERDRRRQARADAVADRQRAERAKATIKRLTDQRDALQAAHDGLLSSIALYIKWRYVTRQLTTDQKDLFADALERESIRVHGPDGEDPEPDMACLPSYAPRWWRDDHPTDPTEESSDGR